MNVKLISIALILMLSLTGVFALSRAEIKSNLTQNTELIAQPSNSMQNNYSNQVKVQVTEKSAQSSKMNFQPELLQSWYPGNGLPYVFSTLITYENTVYRGQPFTIRSHLYSRKNQSIAMILGLYVCDLNDNPSCSHSKLIPAYYWNFSQEKWILATNTRFWTSLNSRFNMSKGEIKTIDTTVTYNGPMPPEGYELYYCGAISNQWFFWPSNPVEKQDYKCRKLNLKG
jgi:hypothetical protein